MRKIMSNMYIVFFNFYIGDINECASFPCQNQAICDDLINSYSCACLDGFDGGHCEGMT